MNISDEQLAIKFKNGDKRAFEELVNRYQKPIFTLCYRYTGNSPDAHDAAQETFIRLYKKIQLYNSDYSFKPWLYKIAVNISKDHLKKQKPWDQLDLTLASSRGDPVSSLENQDLNQQIQRALTKLPEKYRLVIILRHIKQLEYQEISELLKIPLNTVKTHVRRGRELLRHELKEVEL